MINLSRIAMAITAIAATSGCMSMQTPMTDFATDYNRVIADTRNEMILLNIVRARYREPTHYSALSQVSGNMSISGSAGAGLSGIIDDIDSSASIGLSVRSSPGFQIVPLDTAEFANGVLRPIEPNVVAVFLGQGWNENRLAALLIESVTCGSQTYFNDLRGDAGEASLSREQVFGLGFDSGPATDNSNEPVMTLSAEDPGPLNTILDELGDNYSVTIGRGANGSAQFEVRERVPQVLSVTTGSGDASFCNGQPLSPDNYQLRSVQGVIYYLGEILRSGRGLQDTGGRMVFTASNRIPRGGAPIHVSHNGQDWYIGNGLGSDRSVQVIDLISQMIGLQTSSDALERSPSTLTIN